MRSLIIIAALSFASFGLAQGDAPEAPPLHPPEPDDESDASTSTSTTTKTSTSSTMEVDSTTSQASESTTEDQDATTTEPPSEDTTVVPDMTSSLDTGLMSTETSAGGFITVRTETPAQGTPTQTDHQPVVTGAASRLGALPGWATAWAIVLGAALY